MLIKAVFTSHMVYFSFVPPQDVIEILVTNIKHFFWARDQALTGGKYNVKWPRSCRQTELGGIWIVDINKLSRVIMLKWLWPEWKSQDKLWVGISTFGTEIHKLLYATLITLTTGNGARQ